MAVALAQPIIFPLANNGAHTNRKTGMKRKRHVTPIEVEEPNYESDIEKLYQLVPKIQEVFEVQKKVGEGTFSSVYVARLREHPHIEQMFALKHIIPTSHPKRIERELQCLQTIGGVDSVLGIQTCFRDKDNVVFVMPYFQHDRFQDYMRLMSLDDIRRYMKAILLALKRVHQFDIIHRDVKPTNFLYNRRTGQYALVDFGLAQEAKVKLKAENKNKPFFGTEVPDVAKTETSPNKRKLRRRSTENDQGRPPLSPRKGHKGLTEINTNIYAGGNISIKPLGKGINITPGTPGLDNEQYMNKVTNFKKLFISKRSLNLRGEAFVPLHQLEHPKHRRTQSHSVVMATGPSTCNCLGKTQICELCIKRPIQRADRSGTPGFRPPEVLLKHPQQSTAVDIWSVGVILLSLLSGRYPFFRAPTDLSHLAQIITIFGTKEVQHAAQTYGKVLTCSPIQPSCNLEDLCKTLRSAEENNDRKSKKKARVEKENMSDITGGTSDIRDVFPSSAYQLLNRLLDLNPATRITADEALQHPFFE